MSCPDYTDPVSGITHRFEGLWYCSIHEQECNPWPPMTTEWLLEKAALDGSLSDGAFVVVSRVLRGDDAAG